MSKLRIAAIQMRSGVNPDRNAAIFEEFVREAAGKGAVYVQSPEMTGILVRSREDLAASIKSEEDDPIARKAAALAAELSIFVHVGSTAIALGDGKVANRAFLFGPDGALITTYDKIHMFDVDLDKGESWRESATYQPGTRAVVADLPFGKLGLAVCYDLRFPQLFRAQALAGAQVITVPAAFTRQTGEAHWHVLLRARAIENGAWLIAAAQGGKHEDGRETYGHSLVVDPWGEVLLDAAEQSGVHFADIGLGRITEVRSRVPALKHRKPIGPVD